MLTLFQLTNRRIDSLERLMERGSEAVESRFLSVERRIDSSEQQQSSLSERLARLEGLMEAIRDMLTRAPAAP